VAKHYDYIILGTGCAGFSLAYKMCKDTFFADKRILLIDQNIKASNDRTWCFWQNGTSEFEDIVHHQWQDLKYTDGEFETIQNIAPYNYKMIRSAKFYRHCTAEIKAHSNFEWAYGKVTRCSKTDDEVIVAIDNEEYTCKTLFSSILLNEPQIRSNDIYLVQHFKGYFVHTEQAVFKPNLATIMDFSVPQTHGTTFCYVLPLSETDALVEYTLFTAETLPQESYDNALQDYLKKICGDTAYTVVEKEYGEIPMTTMRLAKNEDDIIYIGTAGGATKSSTGYTFAYIQKQTSTIVKQLKHNTYLSSTVHIKRFQIYDATLLQLLYTGALGGKEIFTRLYRKNTMQQLFKFLDSESNFLEDLKIMSTTQIAKFGKAFIKALRLW
jgi:lycopene beta-cyclase